MLSWVLLACTASPTDQISDGGDDDAGQTSLPTEWQWPEEAAEGTISSSDATEVLQEALNRAYHYGPEPLMDVYTDAISTHADACVEWSESTIGGASYISWSGILPDCGAPNSSDFLGQMWVVYGEDIDLSEGSIWPPEMSTEVDMASEDQSITGGHVGGQGYVRTPDLDFFRGAGTLTHYEGTDEARRYGFELNASQGTFLWNGEIEAGAFVETTNSIDWAVRRRWSLDMPEVASVSLTGGIPDMPLTGGTVHTTQLLFDTEAVTDACAVEPQGSVDIRDADGRWGTVVFDGTSGEDACDGCGTLSVAGEDIGQVCVDITSIWDWESSPW